MAQEIIAAPAADVSGRYLALTQLKLCVSKNWRPRLDASCASTRFLSRTQNPPSLPLQSALAPCAHQRHTWARSSRGFSALAVVALHISSTSPGKRPPAFILQINRRRGEGACAEQAAVHHRTGGLPGERRVDRRCHRPCACGAVAFRDLLRQLHTQHSSRRSVPAMVSMVTCVVTAHA